jgi:hypothetical protein
MTTPMKVEKYPYLNCWFNQTAQKIQKKIKWKEEKNHTQIELMVTYMLVVEVIKLNRISICWCYILQCPTDLLIGRNILKVKFQQENRGLMYSTIKILELHPRPHHEGATVFALRSGRVRTGNLTTASPPPWPQGHYVPDKNMTTWNTGQHKRSYLELLPFPGLGGKTFDILLHYSILHSFFVPKVLIELPAHTNSFIVIPAWLVCALASQYFQTPRQVEM